MYKNFIVAVGFPVNLHLHHLYWATVSNPLVNRWECDQDTTNFYHLWQVKNQGQWVGKLDFLCCLTDSSTNFIWYISCVHKLYNTGDSMLFLLYGVMKVDRNRTLTKVWVGAVSLVEKYLASTIFVWMVNSANTGWPLDIDILKNIALCSVF